MKIIRLASALLLVSSLEGMDIQLEDESTLVVSVPKIGRTEVSRTETSVRHPRQRRWLDGRDRLKGDWFNSLCC